ncbi:MAG: DUF547 domain-containing protein [Acidobacteriota bacterium]
MKAHAITLSLCLAFAAPALRADEATDTFGKLLAKYVTPTGVKYAAWRADAADSKALSDVVAKLMKVDAKALPDKDRFAHFINLYNATILDTVVKGKPKESVKDLSSGINPYEIFKREMVDMDGKKIGLNDLEEMLRKQSKDPRVHFAVNCASKSCPPISPEPYTATSLDAQLDKMAKAYFAMPGSINVKPSGKDLTLETVKILDWYKDDFEWAGGGVAFIEKMGPPDVVAKIQETKKAGGKVSLDFWDYDWNLNQAQ